AHIGRCGSSYRANFLDLVIVRIGHIEDIVVIRHTEGMLQPHLLFASAVLIAKLEEPFTNDGLHRAVDAKTNRADRTGLAVRHVQWRAIAADAARLGHRGLQAWGVNDVLAATAGIGLQVPRLQVHDPYLVWASHGDE